MSNKMCSQLTKNLYNLIRKVHKTQLEITQGYFFVKITQPKFQYIKQENQKSKGYRIQCNMFACKYIANVKSKIKLQNYQLAECHRAILVSIPVLKEIRII